MQPYLQTTQTSLLSRVRNPQDHAAWRELEGRYREFLVSFCRQRGLQLADADDVAQAVFVSLFQSLPQFIYDPKRGRFRDYLYRCVRNAISEHARRRIGGHRPLDTSVEAALASPGEDGDAALWHAEWVAHHYRLAMAQVRRDFDARNVEMFDRNVNGESVAALAAAYDVSEEQVYSARRRIRERMQELIEAQVREEDQIDEPSAS